MVRYVTTHGCEECHTVLQRAQGSYESAITFYRVAQASYKQLGLTELADGIDKKMEAAQAGIAAKEAQAAEAEKQKSE